MGHFRVSTRWQNLLWSLMGWWNFCGSGCDESGQNVVEEDRRFLGGGLMASEKVLSFQSLVWSPRSHRMKVLGSREVLRSDHYPAASCLSPWRSCDLEISQEALWSSWCGGGDGFPPPLYSSLPVLDADLRRTISELPVCVDVVVFLPVLCL